MTAGLFFLFRSLQNIHPPLWLIVSLVIGMAIQPFQTWIFWKLIAKTYTKVRESGKEINYELLNDLYTLTELRIMNIVKARIKKIHKK